MSALLKPISEYDYLQKYANHPTTRYELIDGQICAQAGASRKHNRITLNVATKLQLHLQGNPCQPYASDLKVKVGENYFYPDVVVDCGDDDYTANKPVLIVEVLSKSTAFLDKTKKLWEYAQLETLQEYATVEQDVKKVTIFRRVNDWQDEVFISGAVNFDSIGLAVTIDEIYESVF
nr:Uma2 family endonuclease [uncultured Moraxella sp.]